MDLEGHEIYNGMTPEEKAVDLVSKFYDLPHVMSLADAKGCALIAVDEVIKHHISYVEEPEGDGWTDFWKEVKQELDKL